MQLMGKKETKTEKEEKIANTLIVSANKEN